MAGISSTGLGSGIDINNLVAGLIQAESQPTTSRLATKEANLQAELSAIGLLKSALSEFQSKLGELKDAESFSNRTGKSSDIATASISADNNAATGSYSLEINSLASAQKLVTQQDYVVSEGTLEFANASGSFTVTLDTDNNATIQDVRDAINNASDNIGVSATILNVNGNERLVFTTDDTGADSQLTITGTTTSGDLDIYDYNTGTATPDVNGDVAGFYDQVTAAADAEFMVDGQLMYSATNTVTDVIPDATISLKEPNPGSPITLEINQFNTQIKTQIDTLVEGYNELINLVNEQTAYSADSQTAAVLFGDSLINSLERQLRNALTGAIDNPDSEYTSLSAIGITTQSDGTLKVDNAKLTGALNNDYSAITTLFSDETQGIAVAVDTLIKNYLVSDGSFDGRTDSINSKLEAINEQREQLGFRMSKLEARLLSQFNAMDALVYSLNQTGNWLESTLATLPGSYSKKD